MRAGEMGRMTQPHRCFLGLTKEACGIVMGYNGPGKYDVGVTQPWVTSQCA